MGLLETYYAIRGYSNFAKEPYQLKKHEAVEVVAALERQIPRKAWIEAEGEKTISGFCPVCEKDLVYIKTERPRYASYCPQCGQKIDWRGVSA